MAVRHLKDQGEEKLAPSFSSEWGARAGGSWGLSADTEAHPGSVSVGHCPSAPGGGRRSHHLLPGSSDCLDPEEPKEAAKTRTLPASAVVLPRSQRPEAGRVGASDRVSQKPQNSALEGSQKHCQSPALKLIVHTGVKATTLAGYQHQETHQQCQEWQKGPPGFLKSFSERRSNPIPRAGQQFMSKGSLRCH